MLGGMRVGEMCLRQTAEDGSPMLLYVLDARCPPMNNTFRILPHSAVLAGHRVAIARGTSSQYLERVCPMLYPQSKDYSPEKRPDHALEHSSFHCCKVI